MPVASGFIIRLIICTALFHYYSKRRFLRLFEKNVAEILIDMDMKDQLSGRIHEIHQLLPSVYEDNPSSPNPPGNEPSSQTAHSNLDIEETNM
ncbi:CSC1-like protein RXW8 [Fagus crenata]